MTIELPLIIAAISYWLTLVLWTLLGLIATYDCTREYIHALKDYEEWRPYPNGRRIVAHYRKWIAFWFLAGFAALLLLGLLADIRSVFEGPPPIDSTPTTTALRALIVFGIFAFWRAKRRNIRMRRLLGGGTSKSHISSGTK